jgi:hypothetical protein
VTRGREKCGLGITEGLIVEVVVIVVVFVMRDIDIDVAIA